MCPLRLILIFLSATLAGFFVLRGLNSRAAEDGGEAAAEGSAAGGTLPEEEETLCGKVAKDDPASFHFPLPDLSD